MLAAIYARKSTEQNGVGDEEKSVARQIEHATAYAGRKGWTVDEAHVYSDDGISGAEFKKRPGFLRLLNALSPRPPFQILVMSEESRLGREAIETGYVLKQIIDAGVRTYDAMVRKRAPCTSPEEKSTATTTSMCCPPMAACACGSYVRSMMSRPRLSGGSLSCTHPVLAWSRSLTG
jgi:resolvase-like protein